MKWFKKKPVDPIEDEVKKLVKEINEARCRYEREFLIHYLEEFLLKNRKKTP